VPRGEARHESRRQFLQLAAGGVALPTVSRIARAQTYPSRPIAMIVPFAAGGATDVIARIVAERMRVSLGQPVIIENVTGANGTIGVGRAVHASPDGYTISVGHWSTHVVNGAIYALQYDALNDFEPIALIASNPQLIVAKKAMPANDLEGLIAWLKTNPDKASQGTAGNGSASHVGGVFFQKETGTRFQFVPYRGGGPATQDLLAGQIDIGIDDPINYLPLVRAGQLKAYAVTAKRRLAAAPDIPTVDEAGLPGFYFSRWHGLWVPRGTPKNIVAKLNAAVVDALADPGVGSRLADLGQEIFPRDQQTPEALGSFQRAEIEKWWPIVKAANIKGERLRADS
jgi:tripartite-type tricarboxylate transporter receptor subunit TctC